jgi:hypothetical protein
VIRVRFLGATEIRMGSPFRVCRIRLTGTWLPELPVTDWQDVAARRDDGKALALVRWDTSGNVPGFHIVVLDAARRRVRTSRRIFGCCSGLRWVGRTRIAWEAFPEQGGVYRPW